MRVSLVRAMQAALTHPSIVMKSLSLNLFQTEETGQFRKEKEVLRSLKGLRVTVRLMMREMVIEMTRLP